MKKFRPFRKIGVFAIIRVLFLFLVFSPIWSYIWWTTSDEHPINVTILDKTVPSEDYFEHIAFHWILNYEKLVDHSNRYYIFNQDYYGFDPREHPKPIARDWRFFSRNQLDSLADTTELLYLTDTYGVYYNEWILDSLLTEHSPLVYGGLKRNEIRVMERVVDQGKPMWGEFNTFASPTGGYVRQRAEELLNVNWSGWTGRFFDELDSTKNPELPKWLIRGYKEQHGGRWPFEGPGLAFVHESERIEVFDEEVHVSDPMPHIEVDTVFSEHYGTRERVPYPFWFDVTYPRAGTDAESMGVFRIETLPSGDSLLASMGIENTFPALIKSRDGLTWYFCADYADNLVPYSASYFKGIHYLDFLLYTTEPLDRSRFFFHFYRPLITTLLDELGFLGNPAVIPYSQHYSTEEEAP